MADKIKKILLAFLLLLPIQASAVASSVDRITDHIEPLIKTDYIKGSYFIATSTTATSTFAHGIKAPCFSTDGLTCIGSGGGGTPGGFPGSIQWNDSGSFNGFGTYLPTGGLSSNGSVDFLGNDVYLNDGSGSGGRNLNLDGGNLYDGINEIYTAGTFQGNFAGNGSSLTNLTIPGGINQIVFIDPGTGQLGADTGFQYDKTTQTVSVGDSSSVSVVTKAIVGSDAADITGQNSDASADFDLFAKSGSSSFDLFDNPYDIFLQPSATSTFSTAGGINLSAGCYELNGTCIGGSGGGGVTSILSGLGIQTSGSTGNVTVSSLLATSSALTVGQSLYATGLNTFASTPTTTVTCSSGVSCSTFAALGASPISVTNTGVTSIVSGVGIKTSGSTGAVTVSSLIATSSALTIGQSLYATGLNTFASISTSTPTLGAGITYVGGTIGNFIGGSTGAFTIGSNALTLSMFPTIAKNTVIGNSSGVTGTPTAFATSSLGVALSDTTGTLPVNRGGTGAVTFTSSNLLYGIGTGIVQSVATSSATCSSGISCSAFTVVGSVSPSITNTGTLSITPQFGSAITGATTLATSSVSFNGLTVGDKITGSAGTITWTPNWSGILGIAGGGTGAASFPQGWLYSTGGSAVLQSSTSPTVLSITATSTTATSTFAYGINLPSGGCVAVANTCIGSGGAGAVSSVSNSDSTLTISPTTGSVIASINLAHSNQWTNPGLAIDIANTSWYGLGGSMIAYGSTTNSSTVFGLSAGGPNVTTSSSLSGTSAFGYQALTNLTSGLGNSAFGNGTLSKATTSPSNTAVGYQALSGTGNGTWSATGENTAIGYQSMANLSTGSRNTAIGYSTMSSGAVTSQNNVAIGFQALNAVVSGASNTSIGTNSMLNTTGSSNVALGSSAANGLVGGSNNIVIGSNVNPASLTASSQLNIGNILYGQNVYSGGAVSSVPNSNGSLGVGTTSPFAKLAIIANTNDTLANLFMIASSTPTGTTTLFNVDNKGNQYSGGAIPAVSSCGTSPSIATGSNNNAGRIIIGAGVTQATCTMTFAGGGWTGTANAPSCDASIEGGLSIAVSASSTQTTLLFTGVSTIQNDTLTYQCRGF